MILNMSNRQTTSTVDYDNRKKMVSLVAAASIFFASSMSGAILPIEKTNAVAVAPATTSTKSTIPSAAATTNVAPAQQPLVKEKQNVADAKTKLAAATEALKVAEKVISQAKAEEVKAADSVASAKSRVLDTKKQFLDANDKLSAARASESNPNTLQALSSKVSKAKESLTAAESALVKSNAAKSSATRAVSEKSGVISKVERNIKSAKNVLNSAEKNLESVSTQFAKDKEVAKIKAEKAAVEKKKTR
jgi:chromosome segregation ATPase